MSDQPSQHPAEPVGEPAIEPVVKPVAVQVQVASPEAGQQGSQDAAPAYSQRPRSYVLRRSHFSPAQRDAHDRLMPQFGLAASGPAIDYSAVFGRTAPVVLEIGFGMGDATARLAQRHPEIDFLGVEVHTPGVGALLRRIESDGLSNLRVIEGDVMKVLAERIAPLSLAGIHIFFPDPWPKKRHHKRRLIDRHFLTEIFDCLTKPGYVHVATDWPDYAEQIAHSFEESVFGTPVTTTALAPELEKPYGSMIRDRLETKFERRGLALGHPIADWIGQRI